MSLSLYLDDCAYSRLLADLLRAAGHRVVVPADVQLSKVADVRHFEFAATNGLVLVTKNPKDFEQFHREGRAHAGIFVVYQDNDRIRDMAHADVVRAIANLEAAGVPITGQFHVLNQWRY